MVFDPSLAEIRFGCGLSPNVTPPGSVAEMLARLNGPDMAARDFQINDFDAFRAHMIEATRLWRVRRNNRGTAIGEKAKKDIKLVKKAARQDQRKFQWRALMRRAHTHDGLRERLVWFWADHFTAQGKAGVLRRATSAYVETAIRPHVAGRFADMLKAVTTHPLMIHYLDQQISAGPNSEAVGRVKRLKGLNENLAREVLELHTLGVDGPYGQVDVREFAELLTGMSYTPEGIFNFRHRWSEPGAETVLGRVYGGAGDADIADILAALEDLAAHPATARHLASKLATHFLGDAPDAGLVAQLEARYLETGGDLGAVTAALLEHPAAWDRSRPGNVKQPVDFMGSAMRALAVAPTAVDETDERKVMAAVYNPMLLMGQDWERPLGPDGWPEEDEAWLSPQRFSARLDWAMTAPVALQPALPDPRVFVETALGGLAPEAVQFAARAAEDRQTGIGLILISPAFQRM